MVERGEGALDDPADAAESGAVLGLAASDLGLDPSDAELAAVVVVVVAAVGADPLRSSARAADRAAYRRHALNERNQLRDVVAVAAGNGPGKRDPARVYKKLMLRAVAGSINRARARRRAPSFACT